MKRFLIALFIAALAASPALAKNNKGNNGNGNGHNKEYSYEYGDGHKGHGNDRDILRGYVIGHYKKHCPPGLAKKNPPCIPPGQAKKFEVGSRLPEHGWNYVPEDIVGELAPPPRGARYVRMDKNVYLITEGTRKVVEAIELFSEVK